MTRLFAISAATALLGLGIAATLHSSPSKPRGTTVHSTWWVDGWEETAKLGKMQRKPILFLSMFGKLDEKMPCANARTLRATLFKDPEFAKFARDEVVLGWEMVRAVPRVHIDLGDGKKIERTLRGNAVMYVCRPDGTVIDAFPGVYTAADFLPAVREAIAANETKDHAGATAWHKARIKPMRSAAATFGKSAVESPTLDLLGAVTLDPRPKTGQPDTPERSTFLAMAARLRDASLTPGTPDEVARRVLGRPTEGMSPEEIGMAILQADSKNNVTTMRNVIHAWLASEKEPLTPVQARDTVLETILKIPYKDPYFGLKDILLPGTEIGN